MSLHSILLPESARYDWGYEVELNTAPLVELEFDNNGNVTQIDRD